MLRKKSFILGIGTGIVIVSTLFLFLYGIQKTILLNGVKAGNPDVVELTDEEIIAQIGRAHV